MILQPGQMLTYTGTVDSNEDDKGLGRIDVVCPERYGPDSPVKRISPLWPPYLEAVPAVGEPVRLLEFPGQMILYVSLAPPAPRETDDAVIWAPLKAILLAILSNLDDLNSHAANHVHSLSGVTDSMGGALVGSMAAVGGSFDYGDAKSDIDDNKPAHGVLKLVTDRG